MPDEGPAPGGESPRGASPGPPVVGIGASAGGLAALRTFFSNVAADSGLAYVVVVHLAPEQRSHLADLLQPHAKIPVLQVTETVPLEADKAYVIPPGSNLDSVDTHLRLSAIERSARDRAPVDHFFRTLAATHDGRAVGVILSGTGSDGALGIREIHQKEGLTVAQDPAEAEFGGMPQSAIATGLVDLVLPLAEIPDALVRYARTHPRVPSAMEGEEVERTPLDVLSKILALVRTRTGRDFSRYKKSTIFRRIQRRMQLAAIEDLAEYLDVLRQREGEVRGLADDLLITVTSFFRDAEAWEHMEREIVPRLFADRDPKETVRAWSVGCATGEEAYSLAILLLEQAALRDDPPPIQVFASDLHEHSLRRAREGYFPGEIEQDVSAERLRRFFQKEGAGYRVRKEVRELVVFAPHNVMADPPFSHLDVVVCRNVLIYLQRDVQRDLIEMFHYAIGRDGYLWLGKAETVELQDLFRAEEKSRSVFRKRNGASRDLRLPVFPLPLPGRAARRSPAAGLRAPSVGELHEHMVERYAPPSILLNPDHEIVHLSASAGRYLLVPGGEPSTSVTKVIREELRIELRAALHTSRRTGRPVRSEPVRVGFDGAARTVVLYVRPALDRETDGCTIVFFDEREAVEPSTDEPRGTESGVDGERGRRRAEEVEAELHLAKERMQAIVEEYETTQEEMRASHEELQSTNEELRSTMEELETSKEELQSMNEELQTVNQENRHKVEELAQLSSDLQNLLSATEIATLFLDRDLRILRFTHKVSDLFNVLQTDRGRSISDFTNRLGYAELGVDARRVLDKLQPIEREVQDESGRWYLTRVLPYRSVEDHIEGIVLTFFDITERRRAEDRAHVAEERWRQALEDLSDPFVILKAVRDNEERVVDFVVEYANAAACRAVGAERGDFVGRRLLDMHPTLRTDELFSLYAEAIERQATVGRDRLAVAGTQVDVRITPLDQGVSVVWRDVTAAAQAQDSLREAKKGAEQASAAKSGFLATVSHELRTPLNAIVGYTELLLAGVPEPVGDGSVRHQIERIRFAARHLRELIEDVLAFSRLEGHGERIEVTDVRTNDLIEELTAVVDPLFRERGLVFAIESGDAPTALRTDARKLRQILLNLLGNAAKFTPAGSIVLRVRQEGDGVTCEVADTGPGIDDEAKLHLFEPFWQGQAHRGGIGGGAGLGLTISRRYAEMLGGTLAVESVRGEGTTFVLRLPGAPPSD